LQLVRIECLQYFRNAGSRDRTTRLDAGRAPLYSSLSPSGRYGHNPVGLRAYQKRVASFAGAAFAAILGLFSISFGQKEKGVELRLRPKIERTFTNSTTCEIQGKVVDGLGAVIPGVTIKLIGADKKKTIQKTDADGSFVILNLTPETYRIETSFATFKKSRTENFKLNAGEKVSINFELEASMTVTVGLLASSEDPLLETQSSMTITTIAPRKITKLPY
jgi:hypothetical protein